MKAVFRHLTPTEEAYFELWMARHKAQGKWSPEDERDVRAHMMRCPIKRSDPIFDDARATGLLGAGTAAQRPGMRYVGPAYVPVSA